VWPCPVTPCTLYTCRYDYRLYSVAGQGAFGERVEVVFRYVNKVGTDVCAYYINSITIITCVPITWRPFSYPMVGVIFFLNHICKRRSVGISERFSRTEINQKRVCTIKNKKIKADTRTVALTRIVGIFPLVPQISLCTLHYVTPANEMPVSNGLPMTKTLKCAPHVQLRTPENTDPDENSYIYIFYLSVFLCVVNHFSIIHSCVVLLQTFHRKLHSVYGLRYYRQAM